MGNPSPLYPQLEKAALPQLVEYKTDLTKHDREICSSTSRGDAAMYAVRCHGTHWATYIDADASDLTKAARVANIALDYVDAIHGVAPGAQWFHVQCTGSDFGTVTPISFTKARCIVLAQRIRMDGALVRSQRRAA